MISDSSLIVKAARHLVAVDDAGALPDFLDELAAVERAWKQEEHPRDRDHRYRSAHYRNLADILGDLFYCDQSEGIDALKIVNGDLLPALQVNCLFEFASKLPQQKRGAA